jgi:hypothetical protein
MSRLSIRYQEMVEKPRGRGWGPWRVFTWTLLIALMILWASTLLA